MQPPPTPVKYDMAQSTLPIISLPISRDIDDVAGVIDSQTTIRSNYEDQKFYGQSPHKPDASGLSIDLPITKTAITQ